jgi:hypothetical protein
MILTWTCALLLATPHALGEPSETEEEPIEQLSIQALPADKKISLDGFLRANYIGAKEHLDPADDIPEALLGTQIDHARLRLTGKIEGTSYRFGLDALNSELSLQDAWISHEVFQTVRVTLGQFRAPFLTSGLLDADRLLFPVRRTRNGIFYNVRSPGLQVNGSEGGFDWSASIQDGIIDPSDTLATMRVSYDFTGRGALDWEGALGSNFKPHLWATAALSKEDVLESGTASALELHYVAGRYSFALEHLNYGDDYDLEGGPWGPNGPESRGERRGDTQPLSVTATYMFVPDLVEFAVRYEDFDDNGGLSYKDTGLEKETDFNRSNLYLGINYYVDGHDMKIHLGHLHETRDGIDDGEDNYFWAAGISLSF